MPLAAGSVSRHLFAAESLAIGHLFASRCSESPSFGQQTPARGNSSTSVTPNQHQADAYACAQGPSRAAAPRCPLPACPAPLSSAITALHVHSRLLREARMPKRATMAPYGDTIWLCATDCIFSHALPHVGRGSAMRHPHQEPLSSPRDPEHVYLALYPSPSPRPHPTVLSHRKNSAGPPYSVSSGSETRDSMSRQTSSPRRANSQRGATLQPYLRCTIRRSSCGTRCRLQIAEKTVPRAVTRRARRRRQYAPRCAQSRRARAPSTRLFRSRQLSSSLRFPGSCVQ